MGLSEIAYYALSGLNIVLVAVGVWLIITLGLSLYAANGKFVTLRYAAISLTLLVGRVFLRLFTIYDAYPFREYIDVGSRGFIVQAVVIIFDAILITAALHLKRSLYSDKPHDK